MMDARFKKMLHASIVGYLMGLDEAERRQAAYELAHADRASFNAERA